MPRPKLLWLLPLCLAALGSAGEALAQRVCLPLPRLLSTMPMGGQVGTEVEITIATEYVNEPQGLYFSHPGITSAPKLDAEGKPVANRYTVAIKPDVPPGIYEARIMSQLGISSSRVFSVDQLPELTQSSPNTTLETALELPVGSICNSQMTDRQMDHYRFQARKGQRCLIHCASRTIDSKLDAVLVLADSKGRDLVAERRGGVIDYTFPEDDSYVIKVHELTFKGGAGYFYRLSLRELQPDEPRPLFPSTRDVATFSWPPVGLDAAAAMTEAEPNQIAAEAQTISLPCDLSGSFATAADVDMFQFRATKGDVWWIEVASARLGRPTNPSLLVQQIKVEGGTETAVDVVEMTDIASPVKPSSNGYAYDGPAFDGGSPDILGKLEIKEDGLYRLQMTDLFGGTRVDPANVYRMVIRKAQPDFALAAWGLHMELRNGDRNALTKPIALRGGGTIALEVVAFRRDGFDGPIELTLEGLPDGVTAQGLRLGPGSNRGIMLVTAHQDAPQGLTFASFQGHSEIAGQKVSRPCQMAAPAWPIADSWGEIPHPRLEAEVPVSVGGFEVAPITIAPSQPVFEVTGTETLTIPLVHQLRGEFSGSVLQLSTLGHGFQGNPRFDVTLTDEKSQAVIDLAKFKPAPGDHVIAFYGSAVVKHRYAADQPPQDTAEIILTQPITIRVQPAESK